MQTQQVTAGAGLGLRAGPGLPREVGKADRKVPIIQGSCSVALSVFLMDLSCSRSCLPRGPCVLEGPAMEPMGLHAPGAAAPQGPSQTTLLQLGAARNRNKAKQGREDVPPALSGSSAELTIPCLQRAFAMDGAGLGTQDQETGPCHQQTYSLIKMSRRTVGKPAPLC